MKSMKAIIAAVVLTITSASFATTGTKCTQNLSFNGNSLIRNTVAPSSVSTKNQMASTLGVKATR